MKPRNFALKPLTWVLALTALALVPPVHAAEFNAVAANRQIQTLNESGQTAQAMLVAAQAIHLLGSQIRVGQVIEEIETTLSRVEKEVVSERRETNREGGFGIRLLIASLGFGGSQNKVYNVTKFVSQDPWADARFPSRVNRDMERMRERMREYVLDHQQELVWIKTFAIAYFKMLFESPLSAKELASESEMNFVIQNSVSLNFMGNQDVTVCLKRKYAARTDSDSTALAGDLSVLFGLIGGSFSGSTREETQHYAHTEKSCKSTLDTTVVSPEDGLVGVSFNRLDEILNKWASAAQIKWALAKDAYESPTWNTPYLK